MTGKRGTPIERFWRHVDCSGGPDSCWPWTGARNNHGYGMLGISSPAKHLVLAHRFAYELEHGSIPKGVLVCHQCDNPPCCNPRHLYLGTHTVNGQDAAFKGHFAWSQERRAAFIKSRSGENNPRSRLTEQQVRSILDQYAAGVRQASLARQFSVSASTIHGIVSRHEWKRITD